jgi:hypothetical protein
MQGLRSKSARYLTVFFTGIAFMNLSLFQAEVELLDLRKNPDILNISLLLSLAACEEERECGESSDSDSHAKEVDLISHQSSHHHFSFFIELYNAKHLYNEGFHHPGYLEEFCPPPEV